MNCQQSVDDKLNKGEKMVSRKDIQATCDDIVREFAPLQVILFGSYAYGTPSEYSDVELNMPCESVKKCAMGFGQS